MAQDEPESLWLYGEPEPWRRGRTILITIGAFYAVAQIVVLLAILFGGGVELALLVALSLVLFWLALAFIWLGTHWVRWLLGAWTLLLGFTFFIWGMRDQSAMQWSMGVIDLLIGAFCFAPSVHFFAVRQKENIRWPEKLVVGAVFLLLFFAVASTFLGVNFARAYMERDARHYGEEALRRLFVDEDTYFLLAEATEVWKNNPQGNVGITRVLTDKDIRLGYVENTRVTDVALRSFYEFPATLRYTGVVNGEGLAKCGLVQLRLDVVRTGEGWRINGVWWHCLNTRPFAEQ